MPVLFTSYILKCFYLRVPFMRLFNSDDYENDSEIGLVGIASASTFTNQFLLIKFLKLEVKIEVPLWFKCKPYR